VERQRNRAWSCGKYETPFHAYRTGGKFDHSQLRASRCVHKVHKKLVEAHRWKPSMTDQTDTILRLPTVLKKTGSAARRCIARSTTAPFLDRSRSASAVPASGCLRSMPGSTTRSSIPSMVRHHQIDGRDTAGRRKGNDTPLTTKKLNLSCVRVFSETGRSAAHLYSVLPPVSSALNRDLENHRTKRGAVTSGRRNLLLDLHEGARHALPCTAYGSHSRRAESHADMKPPLIGSI